MKVVINGESFEYDQERRPMSEALAIEKAWGRRFAEWEAELAAGSAEAMAVYVWVVLRRNGRDVPLADILDGTFDFDFRELNQSLIDAAAQAKAQAEAEAENPTSGAAHHTAPDGTATTGTSTSRSSRKNSE